MTPKICLIHAVRVAIDPVAEAFQRLWPEAELMNRLDDSLALDRQRDGVLTPKMTERFQTIAQYAVDVGVHGILFTCSAFGPVIEAVQKKHAPLPVLKPNQAMFEEALGAGLRLGLLASFEPSLAPMTAEFAALAKLRNSRATLVTACAPEAMAALNHGDAATHDALLAVAAKTLKDCDAVMLAQFSTARARPAVEAITDKPVLTSPDAAVRGRCGWRWGKRSDQQLVTKRVATPATTQSRQNWCRAPDVLNCCGKLFYLGIRII